ncbi:MAG: hypothetical protein OWQ54_05235 [Sulfolobaceae archaeon]|nr:hypothetical protein [Sulfolobaceae archaeon]
MIHIALPPISVISSNPAFIVFIAVALPLSVFFYFLFRFALPRLRTTPAQQQPEQQPINQQPQSQQRQDITEEFSKTLQQSITKLQESLSALLNSNTNEIKKSIQELNNSIEDAILSIKASQSDSLSPFSMITSATQIHKEEIPEGAKELRAVAEIVSQGIDLVSFIRNCVLMEVLEYDQQKIMALYDLGLISPSDMQIILRIQNYIRTNGNKITAKDLANMAMNVAESYSAATAEMKKYILVLEGRKDE